MAERGGHSRFITPSTVVHFSGYRHVGLNLEGSKASIQASGVGIAILQWMDELSWPYETASVLRRAPYGLHPTAARGMHTGATGHPAGMSNTATSHRTKAGMTEAKVSHGLWRYGLPECSQP